MVSARHFDVIGRHSSFQVFIATRHGLAFKATVRWSNSTRWLRWSDWNYTGFVTTHDKLGVVYNNDLQPWSIAESDRKSNHSTRLVCMDPVLRFCRVALLLLVLGRFNFWTMDKPGEHSTDLMQHLTSCKEMHLDPGYRKSATKNTCEYFQHDLWILAGCNCIYGPESTYCVGFVKSIPISLQA